MDEDDDDEESLPASTKTLTVDDEEEGKADAPNSSQAEEALPSATLQIPAYPPPPAPSSLLGSLNSVSAASGPLAYPRPIHPALMLEAMGFHQRMMSPDGRPSPYASFMAGHPLLPRYFPFRFFLQRNG